jgi:hypothetical protein
MGKSKMNPKLMYMAVIVPASFAWASVARAGSLPTEVIGIFPPDVAEFAIADLQQARSLAWFRSYKKKFCRISCDSSNCSSPLPAWIVIRG